jgi:hypothetical protein
LTVRNESSAEWIRGREGFNTSTGFIVEKQPGGGRPQQGCWSPQLFRLGIFMRWVEKFWEGHLVQGNP